MKPTSKQRRFVDEYLIDLNATQAAIRAGYCTKTAAQQAARLLRNVKIQQAIAKSPEGKARSAMRGFKGGTREMLRELARMLREQAEALERIG
jgi:phage terminase small subunit